MKRRHFFQTGLAATAALALPRTELFGSVYQPIMRRGRDVVAVTGDGRDVTLTSASLADLAGRMRGTLLLEGEAGYEDARHVLNPSFDKRPAVIAQVSGPTDIRHAVDFARENGGLLVAVKCGGHSLSGKSTCDRGMMIDLSRFRDVWVDPRARVARVTGGSLLGAVDHEAMAYDLAVPLGTVSHTGVGGLVTGGGFGRLARRFGLSVDNLLSVDVVTADGQLRRATQDENADLFWGVRGGGGNFGVVTSFEFRLHPMQRQVMAGSIAYPISRAREVLALYADYGPEAPDELMLDCVLSSQPGGDPGMAAFSICYSGEPGGFDRAMAPIRRLGNPTADSVRPMDYVAVQKSGDMDDPRAVGMYTKSGFVSDLPAELMAAVHDRFEPHPARMTQLVFAQSGGAIGRVSPGETAFAQRNSLANMLCMIGWRHGDDPAQHIDWIQQYWSGLERFTDGFYVNDLEEEHTYTAIAANYRQNHQRLVSVKNRYDPTNLFRLNANVQPTV